MLGRVLAVRIDEDVHVGKLHRLPAGREAPEIVGFKWFNSLPPVNVTETFEYCAALPPVTWTSTGAVNARFPLPVTAAVPLIASPVAVWA